MVDRREEAYRAGYENPLIGANGPMQRISGTVSALGEELFGADMGTPVGQKFRARQKKSQEEARRLQELRAQYPEEFGRGRLMSQNAMDPYMLSMLPVYPAMGIGAGMQREIGSVAPKMLPGEVPLEALGYGGQPGMRPQQFYRNVPPQMAGSTRPMTPFEQNTMTAATKQYGPRGYMPEMAVTDMETYGPATGRTSPDTWNRPQSGFDRNMYEAFRQGQFNRMRPMPRADYTPDETGSAVVPYREGGLVYEPVGGPQGAPQGQIGYSGNPRLGYAGGNQVGPVQGRGMVPTEIPGEWSEVYGIGGPRGGYTGSMDFGVTRDGMAVSPSGSRIDPRVAAAILGGGAGFGAGMMYGGSPQENAPQRYNLPPIDIRGPQAPTALSGQTPGPGAAFEQSAGSPPVAQRRAAKGKAGGKAVVGRKEVPLPPRRQQEEGFDPNLNYYVTQALDRLLGQNEAERGRMHQQYFERNPGQGY